MRRTVFLATLLASASVCAFATSPNTWSSFVDAWQNYAPTASDPLFTEIAAFTPEKAVTVTRIEIDAHIGPLNNSTTPFSACVINPSLTLKGDMTAYTLTLNTPPNVGTAFHSYTNSGALNLSFAAGTKLTLTANQGDANCTGGASQVNIVIHYRGADEY
jgi:hypothetical protein